MASHIEHRYEQLNKLRLLCTVECRMCQVVHIYVQRKEP